MSSSTETQSKWRQLSETIVHVGFLGIGAVVSALYLLEGATSWTATLPQKVLIVAVWCPFFWGQYWTHRQSKSRIVSWFFFGAAVAVTALVVVAAFVAVIRAAHAS